MSLLECFRTLSTIYFVMAVGTPLACSFVIMNAERRVRTSMFSSATPSVSAPLEVRESEQLEKASRHGHDGALDLPDAPAAGQSSATEVVAPLGPGPGELENDKFDCHPSVEFWRDFQCDGFWETRRNAEEIAKVGREFALLGADGLQFWAKHVARSGYFAGNAVLGAAAFGISDFLSNARPNHLPSLSMLSTQRKEFPFDTPSEVASRILLETVLSYRQDYDEIRKGSYKEPWDMESTFHWRTSPLYAARQTGRFVREAVGTLVRRKRGSQEDKRIDLSEAMNNDWKDSDFDYPSYYHTAFHYQSNGWMSRRSADAYETSTETLFLGRQDACQRTSLPPLVSLAKSLRQRGTLNRSPRRRPMRILEVACGTGRFMTFVRDNLPDAEYTAVDLSPYYLEVTRENDEYWRRLRGSTIRDGTKPATAVQAKAESLPFENDSFDAVVCVYLFHELPRTIRSAAAREMARVVTPGGVVVLTDSIQRGDRPVMDEFIMGHVSMNEPYYRNYIEDDLPGHFESAGLTCKGKIIRSDTKSISFSKPEEP